ncbi:MAG: hypothetical protein DMD91_28850 [Candidatus Rokuibacteriota bacterium]|nr:MAG: hypothetical protein DMD91_28850 [Candidatus Rokubacteria bacterium]
MSAPLRQVTNREILTAARAEPAAEPLPTLIDEVSGAVERLDEQLHLRDRPSGHVLHVAAQLARGSRIGLDRPVELEPSFRHARRRRRQGQRRLHPPLDAAAGDAEHRDETESYDREPPHHPISLSPCSHVGRILPDSRMPLT